MYNINSHINVKYFFKKLPGEAGNFQLVVNKDHRYFSLSRLNNETYMHYSEINFA